MDIPLSWQRYRKCSILIYKYLQNYSTLYNDWDTWQVIR